MPKATLLPVLSPETAGDREVVVNAADTTWRAPVKQVVEPEIAAERRAMLDRWRVHGAYRTRYPGWAVPFVNHLGQIPGGFRDYGDFYSHRGFSMPVSSATARSGSYGTPLARDALGNISVSVMANGALRWWKLDPSTIERLKDQLNLRGGVIGGLEGTLPGHNHRASEQTGYIVATMPTPFGPVDAQVPVGGGLALALSNLPVIGISVSGQSNTYAGSSDEDATGDVTTTGDVDFGLWTRGLRDRHRAMRTNIRRFSTSAPGGLAPFYTAGCITGMQPAGQDQEEYSLFTFTPDLIQFSIIHLDQWFQQPQTVYLQMLSAQGGTPIIDYLPGTTRGNNIAGADGTGGYIAGARDTVESVYNREFAIPAHFTIGHESAVITGYASYADALTAQADYVCAAMDALPGNIAHGITSKLITYQANQSRGAADYMTFASGGTLDTHTLSLTDDRIINIGGVFDEKTADGGIHMRGKFQTAIKFAYAFVRWFRFGERIQPPYIATAVWDGATTITCSVLTSFSGPLMEDTDWLPAIPDGGLFYHDDSGAAPAITGFQISNAIDTVTSAITRTMTISLASVPTGANKKIYVAGLNNADDPDWSGGLNSFYVPGIANPWFAMGYQQFCTPEIRWRLCPATINVTGP